MSHRLILYRYNWQVDVNGFDIARDVWFGVIIDLLYFVFIALFLL